MIPKNIAILGAGPSGLFMLKSMLENSVPDRRISIFEKKQILGSGMPYSEEGANREHITNVSANEIPELVTSVGDWLQSVPEELLESYSINRTHFNEYKVLPRLLFGNYLEAQFQLLLTVAERAGIPIDIHLGATVVDIKDNTAENLVEIKLQSGTVFQFDATIICTGHRWPKTFEGKIQGYFDSPYPPSKLEIVANQPVAIKGASLTAIDAIRTLARHNGTFQKTESGKTTFQLASGSPDFKIVLHSRSGLLPAVRFHLEDSHLGNNSLLSDLEIKKHIQSNGGFLSLDFLFENNFKKILLKHDSELYHKVMEMSLEDFTELMMESREKEDAFVLFKREYENAAISMERKESIYWKELLAVLSFALNYPAKYLPAEDMLRLQKSLMPLISIVIAFVPQASATELLAMYEAGILSLVTVGSESEVIPQEKGGVIYEYENNDTQRESDYFPLFVDCVGQPHLSYDELPFKGLLEHKTVSPATLEFQSDDFGKEYKEAGKKKVFEENGKYHLPVSGITISDQFQVVGEDGIPNNRIFIMAVPYIGGYNPDYSGLDFCEEASGRIARTLQSES